MEVKRVGNRIGNKVISKGLAVFGFGQIQDAANLISVLKKRGVSIDEFMDWVRYMQLPSTRAVHNQLSKEKTNTSYICPDCGLPLLISEVNTAPCNNIGGDYRTVLYCYDDIGCSFDMYSNNSIKYWNYLSEEIGISEPEKQEHSSKQSSECGGCGKKA